MSKKIEYRRSLAAARKLIEARTAATQGFTGLSGLTDKLLQLDLDDLPEEEHKHHKGYVGAILEFAAQHAQGHGSCGMDPDHSPAEHNDPRKFARLFLNKRPEYSRTPNGLAASQLEAWLMESSGYLFSRFVETVLEDGKKFVAIFEGKLNKEELRRMQTGTAPFMSFEPLIEAGANNGEEVFEFTILDCTAQKVKKELAQPAAQTTPPAVSGPDGDVKLSGVSARMESLLPSSREEYDAVYEAGGVKRNALAAVLGDDALDTLVEGPSGARLVDANGVTWTSEDGRSFVPDVDSLDEGESTPSQQPRNYRKQDGWEPGSCGNCRYYRREAGAPNGECELFEVGVEPMYVCDEWGAMSAMAESEEDDAPEPRTMVSDFGTWELHEQEESTVVVVEGNAVMVGQGFDELVEALASIGRQYEAGLEAERDLMVESVLREMSDEGVPCGRPDELAEDQREERDATVKRNNATRLQEAAQEDDALWDEAAEGVSEDYPDVERDSATWHELVCGRRKTILAERQKTTPGLALPSEAPPARTGAFKISSQALKLFRDAGLQMPSGALTGSQKKVVNDIARDDLPKLVGITTRGPEAMPAAQDVIAHRPRKAFQTFMRKAQTVAPKLHKAMQAVPHNAPLYFYMLVTRISGEDSALWLFKRFFASFSDHPEAVKRRPVGESLFPVTFDPEAARLDEKDEEDDKEADGKKP